MSSVMFKAVDKFVKENSGRGLPIIVVAGGGQWALQYAKALHWFMVQKSAAAVFVYQSEYGLGTPQYHRYLRNTLGNMIEAEQLGALCIDLSRLTKSERDKLPQKIQPKTVFVVTPPETHCKNAIEWAGHTDYIFIEKPFDADPGAIKELKDRLNGLKTKVFGFDHYAARLEPYLTQERLKEFGFGKCVHFDFEMLEASPRGLEERAPSIADTGILFDMASHALPVLSWLIKDFNGLEALKTFHKKLYASTLLSPANKRYIEKETFGRVELTSNGSKKVGNLVKADIKVGKGVGITDSKMVTLTDDKGIKLYLDQWFMLARCKKKEYPIHERVIYSLVNDVISKKDPKKSAGVFDIDLGLAIVDVLVSWTSALKAHLRKGNELPSYRLGLSCKDICQSAYIE